MTQHSSQHTPSVKKAQPVWVVTGAAGTLGQALVQRVLADGGECVAIDKNPSGLEALSDQAQRAGRARPLIHPLDLAGATLQDLYDTADAIGDAVGSINHLVHAAGAFKAMRPLLHQPPQEWLELTQVGIHAPLFLTQRLTQYFSGQPRDSIVWVVDPAPTSQPAHWGAYGLVQQAQRWMAATLDQEIGPKGPRVVTWQPPTFYSPISAQAWPARSQSEYAELAPLIEQLMGQIQASDDTPPIDSQNSNTQKARHE